MKRQPITHRERVALFALAAGYIENWTDCYIAASQENEETTRRRGGLNTTVQRWKARTDIRDAFQAAKNNLFEHDEQIRRIYQSELDARGDNDNREDGTGGSVRTEERATGKRRTVDYLNPENQAAKLNELVNRADSTGETLDALKVIIATQKADRDAARDGKQVKCYVPISCDSCPLYEKARKK
jgi:hypothetical protein